MDILSYGDVVPGKSIGAFQIGMKAEQLLNMLKNYQIEQRSNCIVVKTSTLWFWLDEENKMFQIMSLDGFLGKYAELIGIGDTISDIEKHFGKCTHESYVVKMPNVEGICFELKDVDDYDQVWDESSAPGSAAVLHSSFYCELIFIYLNWKRGFESMNNNIIWGIVLLALSLFLKPLLAIVGLNERLFGLNWQGETVFSLSPFLVRIILAVIGIIMLIIGGMQVAKQKNK